MSNGQTKGHGVFAKKAIPSNTIIVQQKPILSVRATTASPAVIDAAIEAAFKKLNKQDQGSVLQLHEGCHPSAKPKITRIFHANAFSDDDTDMLYLTSSRLNHSYLPNASVHNCGRRVGSGRAIAPGEEITISYLPPFSEAMTACQRATCLERHYGFECRCQACWPLQQRWVSNARRKLIGFMSSALKGQSPPDFKPFNSIYSTDFSEWPPQPRPRKQALTSNRGIEYNMLLASLRESEGLPNNLAAECYLQAARLLMVRQTKYEELPATKDIVFLEAARCIKDWYHRGTKLGEKYYGPEHERTREVKKFWRDSVPWLPCLQILQMLPMIKESRSQQFSGNGDYAIRISEEGSKAEIPSKEETAASIHRRLKAR